MSTANMRGAWRNSEEQAQLTEAFPRATSPRSTGSAVVVGLGYVGLPTALSLAEAGIAVTGVDVDEDRLRAIKAQQVDLSGDDLEHLGRSLANGRLAVTTNAAAISGADFVLISVPTPVDTHLVPDMRALTAACATVVANAVRGQTIVLTSTTYVGCTHDLIAEPLRHRNGWTVGEDVYVAFSPERIDPGVARHDRRSTPRVVGGVTAECGRRAEEAVGNTAAAVHRVTSPASAELTKLLENSFRAVNIAMINEFADSCRAFGVDPIEVIDAAATKPYGFMPFHPGPGVGGHCIPCDTHYLLWQLRAQRLPAPLMNAAMGSIAARPRRVVDRARQLLADRGKPFAGAKVLVLGVSYKPGVADVRESPALEIMTDLAVSGVQISYADPFVPAVRLGDTTLLSGVDVESEQWDLVIVHTVHPDEDPAWLSGQDSVLDTTYRLSPDLRCAHL
ncbi:nucleotide sugar dehydrogenase [Saccharopolyspora mangrovi]|uniref:Nucleotide sugar dehydrogenase n=1 Tax=Saccharopolyspora mangrovi TaxID=3082379 RepID=A0ABU6AJF2_9PSEU|nr:nucleotide sugar dehydrogenase [Saccharopolyspora sp. S2-29]MEB3371646.1 nucleotide sugar dehydrogenase [Saccharopolyspora sp. S2-29]